MKNLLTTTILAGFLAVPVVVPAFAASHEAMSCADFMALDSDGQMEAVHAMHEAAMMDDDMDDMASDDMKDDMSDDDMASEDMKDGDDMASDDMMDEEMTDDDMSDTEMVSAYCADHPDMTIADSMAMDSDM